MNALKKTLKFWFDKTKKKKEKKQDQSWHKTYNHKNTDIGDKLINEYYK